MLLLIRVSRELRKGASKVGVFPKMVSDSAIGVFHASTNAFVLACVCRGRNPPRWAVGLEKTSLYCHHILLRIGTRHTFND